MIDLLSLCLLYLACFAFFQAGERRTEFAGVKASKRHQTAVRAGGWGIALLSLVLMAGPQGWERGTTIWLAQFMLAAFVALFIGSLAPRLQIGTAIAMVVVSLMIAALIVSGVGSA
ncbi:MAG: DUF3325 family protein [Pseudomonadota bacterium]